MKTKSKPHLSLDYISEQLGDLQISALIEEMKQEHMDAITSIKYHRPFIAHNPLNENHKSKINAMGYLFDALEKTIIEIGRCISHGFIEGSLYKDYNNLEYQNTEDIARISAQKIFEAIMDWHNKNDLHKGHFS